MNIKFKENIEQTENFISKLILPDHIVFHPKNWRSHCENQIENRMENQIENQIENRIEN